MIHRFLLLMAALFILPTAVMAEVTAADRKEIDTKVDAFFASWTAGNIEDGYAAFMNEGVKDNVTGMNALYTMTRKVVDFFQTPFKHELVEENTLSDKLVYRQYMIYNDRAPYWVIVVMYKTSKGWVAQHIVLRDLVPEDLAP